MEVLVATRALAAPGGSETYLHTVVPQLRQLGHGVTCYSPLGGESAERLRSTGVAVHHDLSRLERPDVAHVQHAPTALHVRGRFPDVPIVYVCHSSVLDVEDPPAGVDPQAVVALSESVTRRLRAGTAPTPVRLRQPVAVPYADEALVPIGARPRRALLAAHRARAILPAVRATCAEEGIELVIVDAGDGATDELTTGFMAVDIVFAVGRTLLEAMAVGRAGFVLDDRGSGGFVDGTTYAALEASAFARFDPTPVTVDSLRAQLATYRPELGRIGLELVRRHHSARIHARDLVEVYEKARSVEQLPASNLEPILRAYGDALEERFRLTFANRAMAWQAAALERELADAHRMLEASSAEADRVEHELDALNATRVMRWSAPLRRVHMRRRDR
jgi:hypothetical protein